MRSGTGGLRLGLFPVREKRGRDGIVGLRQGKKISNSAAINVTLHGSREDVAEHGREVRVEFRMSQHGGADDDFSAGIEFVVGALLRGEQRQPSRLKLLLLLDQVGKLLVD